MLFKNIKVIVLDLDGTLLNNEKKVSERNIKAVMDCHRKGIHIIFATARAPRSVKQFLPKELQNIGMMVYYNGALLRDQITKINYHYPIGAMYTAEIINFVTQKEPDSFIAIEVEDTCYINQNIKTNFITATKPIVITNEEMKQRSVSKILLHSFSHHEKLEEQFRHKVNVICTDQNQLVQIMGHNVSKENAVLNWCQRHEISAEQVMVFGDDWNDIGLFKECGYPIAMENAISELKELAYYITDSNEDDGVASILDQIRSDAGETVI
ncbi:HAD family hydrolase [Bacillus cereus group sp. N21]|uniref:HAD family hydrolase n=1 Tax=Bacillus cereus group sp. N21 TaxID=2794591 RepID=UPI0018F76ED6|nr:HAD family hydrolase [Bacillus cereus group sp. N21]MBJ8029562.1 HAD family hydrolase [Bacillus cereus group sp. N21]